MPKIDKIQMPNGTVYDIGGGSPDEVTISLNSDNELQAIALMDEGDNTARKERFVTQAQYDAMKEAGTLDDDTYYNTPDDVSASLLETIYPVGSIYITTNNTCPLSALFGTWQIQAEPTNNKFIIESNVNGASGYRIWNDGYCEQWGRTIKNTDSITVNLLKEFKDTNYYIFIENFYTDSYVGAVNYISAMTTSSFAITSENKAPTFYNFWKASGYLATGEYTPVTIPQYNKFRRIA